MCGRGTQKGEGHTMGRIVFLSDSHLTVWGGKPWLDQDHLERLALFLDQLAKGKGDSNGVERVVLLGDIFDTWHCPTDRVPPSYDDIFAQHSSLLDKMAPLAKGGRLTYVIGNHDFDIPESLVQQRLPGVKIIGPNDGEDDCFWVGSCKLYAKHGHQYSLFNNVSRPDEQLEGYPIGYYITRLHSGQGDGGGGGGGFNFGQLQNYIHEIRDILGKKESVFESVIDAVAGKAKEVRVTDQVTVSLADIEAFARDLGTKYTAFETAVAAMAEGTLVSGANTACSEEGARLVVLGHTHLAITDDYAKFPPKRRRTYANTGCWCKGQPNFVVADTDEATLAPFAFYSTGEWVAMREPENTD